MPKALFRRSVLAGAAAAAATAPAVRAQGARKLLFWHYYTQPERVDYLRRMADLYQAQNPGLAIAIESMPYPAVVNRVAAAKPANALPDLLIHGADTAIPLFAGGDILPVDDVVKQLGGADSFLPHLMDRMSLYQGHYLSLPHYVACRVLIYRKDRLATAGLAPPQTWEDLLKVDAAMTAAPDHYGLIYQLNRADTGGSVTLYPFAVSAAGSFFNAKGDVTFNSAPVRDATAMMVEMIRSGAGPGAFTYNINDNFNLVNSGKTSMTLDTAALVAVAVTKAPDVAEQLDAVLIPHRAKPAHLLQGGCLMMLKGQNKNPQDAAGFAQFLMQPANLLEFLHTIPLFMLPTTKATAGDAFYGNPVIGKYRSVAKTSVDALETACLFGCDDGINPFAGPVQNAHIIEEMLARIVLDHAAVPDAVATAHDQMAALTGSLRRRLRL